MKWVDKGAHGIEKTREYRSPLHYVFTSVWYFCSPYYRATIRLLIQFFFPAVVYLSRFIFKLDYTSFPKEISFSRARVMHSYFTLRQSVITTVEGKKQLLVGEKR